MKKNILWIKSITKIVLLFLFIALAFSYSMFQGGFVSWFLFYSFMPFGLYSVLLAFYPLGDFTVQRTFNRSGDLKDGDSLAVTVTIERSISIPLFFLIVEDVVPETLAGILPAARGKRVLFPGFKRKMKYEYAIKRLPRGEHIFSEFKLKTGDAIGLIEKERLVSKQSDLLVYPSYTDLTYRTLESRYDQGTTSSKVKIQKDTTMVSGVREYLPGDRVSWVHWKATAKTNTIMTKEFEEKESHDVLVVLDRTPSRSFELMVKFTASIVKAILKRGAQMGMISIGETPASFPIRGGDFQQQQLFYHLAKVKPDSGIPIGKILKEEVNYFQQSVTMLIISSELTQELVQTAGYHAKRRGVVVLFVIKPEKEPLGKEEAAFREMAAARGVHVKVLHEPEFTYAFTEVKRA
ncbi:DUF58 domain-containing protein [Falsibacillus pallidus]|uniref:Uncharacterized protein (DUF58 family) n=1 Tax=Falsibacillus pallidus TaxID=493781 RepID=A0A370G4K3_9BACI|nr:DUF58 domain-containing protein [Falsibacillus pallidus]RDI37956.1 uncharacterized protein (DUF58 family) [Falsibacillus pallidus]